MDGSQATSAPPHINVIYEEHLLTSRWVIGEYHQEQSFSINKSCRFSNLYMISILYALV